MESPECDTEEKKSNQEFIEKIKPHYFKDHAGALEV